ncbi:MAG: sulfate adenylyltransferase subunit CysN [Planctomycetota bacterium]
MGSSELDRLGIEGYLENYRQKTQLRFLTCGSVDDGKSTLIGRLLHDASQVFEDQLAAARVATGKYGTTGGDLDYALLLDGLEAEREQGITIDVAYRYFSTDRRKFVIADTPGHEQYTRNMATGASHCDLAVILVDARKGVLEQTRRHAFLSALLGIQHLVVAVNKMDIVGYDERVFERIRADFIDFAAKLQVKDLHFIPTSGLRGDNVVHRSPNMPWYSGSPLLDFLENVHVASDRNLVDPRFPVQLVLRPDSSYRGFAGTVASGVFRRGDEIVSLPSGRRSRIARIDTFGGSVDEAFAGMAVVIALETEIDTSRGDMFAKANNAPTVAHDFEAMLVWMAEEPMMLGGRYVLDQTTNATAATVTDLRYRMDIVSFRQQNAATLALNEIGRVRIETMRPLCFDAYQRNKTTGSFILVDRMTNATVAAGMILERVVAERALGRRKGTVDAGRNVERHRSGVSAEERSMRLGQKPFAIWFTGLPRSGKTTVALALERALFDAGLLPVVLAGGELRQTLGRDLGFSGEDRWENQRRAAEVARIACDAGLVAICALVSPLAADREQVRQIVGPERFLLVHCDAPMEVCEQRDGSGLFAAARAGEICNVTGIDAPYEPPSRPDCLLSTGSEDVESCVRRLVAFLRERGWLPARS